MPPGGLPHEIGIWANVPSLCSIALYTRPGSWQTLLGTARSNPPSTQEQAYLDNTHAQPADHYYDGWNIRFPGIASPTGAVIESYFGTTNAVVLDSPLGAAPTGEDYRLSPPSVIEGTVGTGTWDRYIAGPTTADKLFRQVVVVDDSPVWRPLPTVDWDLPWPLFMSVSAAPNQTVQIGMVDVKYAYRRGRMAPMAP
jgi:hypothetical protein